MTFPTPPLHALVSIPIRSLPIFPPSPPPPPNPPHIKDHPSPLSNGRRDRHQNRSLSNRDSTAPVLVCARYAGILTGVGVRVGGGGDVGAAEGGDVVPGRIADSAVNEDMFS